MPYFKDADEVYAYIGKLFQDLAQDEERRGRYDFLATGEPHEFRRLGTRFLQLPIATVEHVAVAKPVRRAA